VFHSVALLGLLGIIEKVKSANQIAGDAADTFKPDSGPCQSFAFGDGGFCFGMYHKGLRFG
jgi:hypothetical protein